MTDTERLQLAEKVRWACERAALAAYEAARMDGLCEEGAFEAAIGALHSLDLRELATARAGNEPRGST